MARISTYALDPTLEGGDRIIGSDASNANATMNFSLAGLGDFYTRTGLADATRLGYRFTIADTQATGTGSFTGGPDMSSVTQVFISSSDLQGFDTSVLNQLLENGRVKLISTRSGNDVAQGFYTVTDVVSVEVSTVIVGFNVMLTTIPEAQSGSLRITTGIENPDIEFILIPLPSNATGMDTSSGTGENTGDQFLFRDIVIEGTSVSAESVTDDLIFDAGAGIVLSLSDTDNGASLQIASTVTGITAQQAADILANNAKVGITSQQATDINTNNAKVGITPQQSIDITNNNAKVGITPQQAIDITTNNTKVGITPEQIADIATNSAKNSYPATDAAKLAGIEAEAEVNVQANWDTTDTASDAFILNKPTALSEFTNDLSITGETNLTLANRDTDSIDIVSSSSGAGEPNAVLPSATGLLAGLMSADDKTKLDAVVLPTVPTGTFTIHAGRYTSVGASDPTPDFPNTLQGTAMELMDGDEVTFTATTADDDFAVIQIETADFMSIVFHEITGNGTPTLVVPGTDDVLVGVNGGEGVANFTSYRFPYGGTDGTNYILRMNFDGGTTNSGTNTGSSLNTRYTTYS